VSTEHSEFDGSRSAAGDHNPWLIAVVVSIATFMLVLDTSIANVALRNEGGSIGVSLVTTMLAQREQFHQSRPVDNVSQASPQFQAMVHQGAQHFTSTGASLPDAQHQALGLIGQLVQNQSQLLSYIDVYFVLAVIAAVMVPVALMLRPMEREPR
jgi:hypothetical protein